MKSVYRLLSNQDHTLYKIQFNNKIFWLIDWWVDISDPVDYEMAKYCFDKAQKRERAKKDVWNVV